MGQIFSAKCTSSNRLDGKTAIITGANTGIGKCIAQDFYLRGARVVMACRSLEKAGNAIFEIKRSCEGKPNLGSLNMVELDLNSVESIRKCADKILKEEGQINILLNNAGVMFCPENKTKDGFETHISTNYLGHFLLTLLLLPKIIKSAPARIINVSSVLHEFITQLNIVGINWKNRTYYSLFSYAESKAANVLFTKELAQRLNEAKITGVTTYVVHPGIVATELRRHLDKAFFPGLKWIVYNIGPNFIKTPEQGAQTSIYCAVDEKAGKETGLYYAECKAMEPNAITKNSEDAKQLWEVSCKLLGLDNYDPFLQKPASL